MSVNNDTPISINDEVNREKLLVVSPASPTCLCNQNGYCNELNCLQKKERPSLSPSVDSIGSAQNGILGQTGRLGLVKASYGSLEDQNMTCLVRGASSPEPDDSSVGSNESSQPLLNAGPVRRSDLVSC